MFEPEASEITKQKCQPHSRDIQLNLCGLMTICFLLFGASAALRNAY
jgi:hypothetical protein